MKKSYILIFLASIVFVYLTFYFREKLVEFSSLGLLGILLINFFGNATVFLPAPAIASVVAGGVLYSPFLVALVASLGASGGDMVSFILGHSSRKLFIREHHSWYKTLRKVFEKFGDVAVFIFAFVPNPFFDGIGIIAGIFSYSPLRFFIIMFAGRLIRNILLAFLGYSFAFH